MKTKEDMVAYILQDSSPESAGFRCGVAFQWTGQDVRLSGEVPWMLPCALVGGAVGFRWYPGSLVLHAAGGVFGESRKNCVSGLIKSKLAIECPDQAEAFSC